MKRFERQYQLNSLGDTEAEALQRICNAAQAPGHNARLFGNLPNYLAVDCNELVLKGLEIVIVRHSAA